MKNLTRVLALVLTFAMMISTVAMAATFTDIEAGSTYAEATAVLADLGILYGYEDGTFGADKVITRAEVVAVVNRLQGLSDAAKAAGGATQYTDVPSTEWYAGDVNLATQMGIVSGDGNGLFRPNDQVKYEEAVKMVVAALGYNQEYVLRRGGWPTGYLVIATEAEISKGLSAGAGDPAYRGIVAKLAYNSLTAPTFAFKNYSTDGTAVYGVDEEKIVLEEKLQTYKLTGYVSANSVTSLTNANVTENDEVNFAITTDKVGKTVEDWEKGDDDTFVTATDVANTLGYTTDVYVRENAEGDYEIISYVVNNAKNKTVTIENPANIQTSGTYVSDIDGVGEDYIAVFDEEVDTIDTKYSLSVPNSVSGTVYAKLIVNGDYLGSVAAKGWETMYNLSGAADADLGYKFAPKYGTVTLLDNNNDGAYDVVFVDSYVVARVTSVVNTDTAKKIFISGGSIDLTNHYKGEKGYTYSLELDGEEADISDLQKDDVIAVAMSTKSGSNAAKKYDIKATRNTVSGLVSEVICDYATNGYTNAADWEFSIDGNAYTIANLADPSTSKLDTVKAGSEVTFYLDAFGNVAYTDVTSTTAKNYGFVAGLFADPSSIDGTTYQIRILDKDGDMTVYDIAENVKFAGEHADGTTGTTSELAITASVDADAYVNKAEEAYAYLDNYMAPAGSFATGTDNWTITDAAASNANTDNYAKRIITYKVNSAGKVSEIVLGSVTGTEGTWLSYDAAKVTSTGKYLAKSNSIGGIFVSEDTVVFNLPIDDKADKDSFTVDTIASLVNEETYNVAFLSIDEDGIAGAIVITSDAATVGGDSNLAVVTKVTTSQDANYDNIYNISFLQNGEAMTLATTADLYEEIDTLTITAGDVFEYKTNGEGAISAIGLMNTKNDTWTNGGIEAIKSIKSDYVDTNKQDYVFGVVYNVTDSRVIKIGTAKDIHAVSEDANFYMVDLTKKKNGAKNYVTVSDYSEILAYEEDGNNVLIPEYDYAVFMKYSNDEIIDVVIYKGFINR